VRKSDDIDLSNKKRTKSETQFVLDIMGIYPKESCAFVVLRSRFDGLRD